MSEVLIILFLIFVNGIISLSETALITARKSKLESLAGKGDLRAKSALGLKEDPDLFLSTVQIYITLVAILTGVYSGERFSHHLVPYVEQIGFLKNYATSVSLGLIVVVVTFLSILFGELVPKRIAILNPEGIARIVARPVRTLSFVSYPLVWLLSSLSGGIFRMLKINPSEESIVTEDEIKAMINEGSESGTIEEEEKDIIERVFHLGDRNITSMMTHRTDIVWFEMNESPESVRSKIEEYQHSVYPVCRGNIDDIEGVVHVKDLYLYSEKRLVDLLRKPLFVPENNSAYQVLEKIKNTKIHHAFIVDEYGSLQGMITARDILRAIVGEIPEEEDDEYVILKRDDGTYLIDAQIQFYDFLSYFEKASWVSESENEFDTLAGFVLHTLERIPTEGDKFEWRGFDFEIVDMDGQRIDKIIVRISDEIRAEMEEDEE
ncbi:MAG: HlyC/CorC family transporter [Chitinophagaceae bacterium]|nr:HlyC/CorC family transporter [Chitinophagaceae bacterium]